MQHITKVKNRPIRHFLPKSTYFLCLLFLIVKVYILTARGNPFFPTSFLITSINMAEIQNASTTQATGTWTFDNVPDFPSRSETMATRSSVSSDASELRTTFFGSCPVCHHLHNKMNITLPRRPQDFETIRCENTQCRSRLFGLGGNSSHSSFASQETIMTATITRPSTRSRQPYVICTNDPSTISALATSVLQTSGLDRITEDPRSPISPTSPVSPNVVQPILSVEVPSRSPSNSRRGQESTATEVASGDPEHLSPIPTPNKPRSLQSSQRTATATDIETKQSKRRLTKIKTFAKGILRSRFGLEVHVRRIRGNMVDDDQSPVDVVNISHLEPQIAISPPNVVQGMGNLQEMSNTLSSMGREEQPSHPSSTMINETTEGLNNSTETAIHPPMPPTTTGTPGLDDVSNPTQEDELRAARQQRTKEFRRERTEVAKRMWSRCECNGDCSHCAHGSVTSSRATTRRSLRISEIPDPFPQLNRDRDFGERRSVIASQDWGYDAAPRRSVELSGVGDHFETNRSPRSSLYTSRTNPSLRTLFARNRQSFATLATRSSTLVGTDNESLYESLSRRATNTPPPPVPTPPPNAQGHTYPPSYSSSPSSPVTPLHPLRTTVDSPRDIDADRTPTQQDAAHALLVLEGREASPADSITPTQGARTTDVLAHLPTPDQRTPTRQIDVTHFDDEARHPSTVSYTSSTSSPFDEIDFVDGFRRGFGFHDFIALGHDGPITRQRSTTVIAVGDRGGISLQPALVNGDRRLSEDVPLDDPNFIIAVLPIN